LLREQPAINPRETSDATLKSRTADLQQAFMTLDNWMGLSVTGFHARVKTGMNFDLCHVAAGADLPASP
jgi:hypothetical protein